MLLPELTIVAPLAKVLGEISAKHLAGAVMDALQEARDVGVTGPPDTEQLRPGREGVILKRVLEDVDPEEWLEGRPAQPRPEVEALEEKLASAPEATGAGLMLYREAVFSDTRKRINLVFRINVAISTVLASLLLGGIAGAIVAGFMGRPAWALVFGGVAAADIVGVLIYRPLDQIQRSLVQTSRLDLIVVRIREGLDNCESRSSAEEQLECATGLWNQMQSELVALSR